MERFSISPFMGLLFIPLTLFEKLYFAGAGSLCDVEVSVYKFKKIYVPMWFPDTRLNSSS